MSQCKQVLRSCAENTLGKCLKYMNQVKGAMKETETEKGKMKGKERNPETSGKKGKRERVKDFPMKIHSALCPTISHDHPSTFYL